MSESTDFSLESAEGNAAPGEPPVIVIEYRQRGLLARLAPPALILLLAVAITSYQRTRPVRFLAPRPQPAETPTDRHAPPRTSAPDDKIIVRAATSEPAAPKEAAPDTPPASAPSPFELGPDSGLQPLDPPAGQGPPAPLPPDDPKPAPRKPPELAAVVPPQPAPEPPAAEGAVPPPPPANEVSKDDILRDIEREAQQKADDTKDLADLKPRARALLLMETLNKVHAARVPFRNEVRDTLKSLGREAGPMIDKLCDQYGREMPPEVRVAYQRVQRITPKRMTQQAQVDLMRGVGLPEPVILDFLAHRLHKTLNTRGGPRDEDEVRVRAAQLLLSYPLPTPRKPAAPPFASAAARQP